MATFKINTNAVKSALNTQYPNTKTLGKCKICVYTGWEDENYTRARVNFYVKDTDIESYFLHVGADKIKVWGPGSGKNDEPVVLEGKFTD